jgi:hypothetical protein
MAQRARKIARVASEEDRTLLVKAEKQIWSFERLEVSAELVGDVCNVVTLPRLFARGCACEKKKEKKRKKK